jgi:hypothetical protein
LLLHTTSAAAKQMQTTPNQTWPNMQFFAELQTCHIEELHKYSGSMAASFGSIGRFAHANSSCAM